MKLGVGDHTESETRVVRKYMTSERNQMTSCMGVRIGEVVPGKSDSGVRKSDSEMMVTGARDRDISTSNKTAKHAPFCPSSSSSSLQACYVSRFPVAIILWPYVRNASLEPGQALQPIISGSR